MSSSPESCLRRRGRRVTGARLAAGCLAALVLAGPAGARGAEEENEDFLFARELTTRGWAVVAERAIEKGMASARGADKDRFRVLQAELLLQEARRIGGSQERRKAFGEALTLIDTLVPGEGKPKLAAGQALNELGDFLVTASGLLSEEAERETEAARAKDLRVRGLRMVGAAEKVFSERLEVAQRATAVTAEEEGEEENADEEGMNRLAREEMDAAFSLARARFQRAMITEGKTEKVAAVQEAIRQLEDFQVTYSQTALAYEAAILMGQCHTEAGDHKRAALAFEAASSAVDLFRDESGEVHVNNPYAAGVIQRALLLTAQAHNKAGAPRRAQEAVEKALRLFPEIVGRPIGHALRLEQAQALANQGDYARSGKLAERVEAEDPEGPGGAAARAFLGRIVGRGAGVAGGSQAVKGFLERGEVHQAIMACRRLLARAEASPKADEESPALLLLLGTCYAHERSARYREAALLFEEVVDRYPSSKLAPEAAFEAVNARLRSLVKAYSKFDQERKDRLLKVLTENYAQSPQAAAGKYLQAQELMEANKLEEAARMYLEVPENAGQYRDNALYQAALVTWNLGLRQKPPSQGKPYYQKAVKLFQDCLQVVEREDPKLDPERLENRKAIRLLARLRLAELYSSGSLKRHQEALEILEKIAREDQVGGDQEAQLLPVRARTLAALGKIDDAVQSYGALKSKFPASRALPSVSREIALAYDSQARKASEGSSEKDRAEYLPLLKSALEHYAGWVEESRRLKLQLAPALADATAERALAIALEVSGLPAGKDSFTDALGRRDVPRAEWQRAVKLMEEARPRRQDSGANDWVRLARLGRAYGFVEDWAKARVALEEALVWGGFLATVGEPQPNPNFSALDKAPDLLDIFIDLGFAELIPGQKGKLVRAQTIFNRAFDRVQRETCAFWKCRYGFLLAEFKEGNYERADAQLKIIHQAFPDWDANTCELKERFDSLRKDLEAKLAGSANN